MANLSQEIITTIMADINAVMPNYQVLVSSQRLLVGAAEEIQRTPGVPKEVFERAVLRMDNAGTLIDIFLDLLLCKISFTSDFLGVTCAPVDLFRILANRNMAVDTPYHTGEQILQLELLRRLLDQIRYSSVPDETPPDLPLEGVLTPKNPAKAKTAANTPTPPMAAPPPAATGPSPVTRHEEPAASIENPDPIINQALAQTDSIPLDETAPENPLESQKPSPAREIWHFPNTQKDRRSKA